MAVVYRQFVAAVASIAVVGGFSASNFADAALLAMVDAFFLAFVIVKSAHLAVVLAEWLLAARTRARFRLDFVAA